MLLSKRPLDSAENLSSTAGRHRKVTSGRRRHADPCLLSLRPDRLLFTSNESWVRTGPVRAGLQWSAGVSTCCSKPSSFFQFSIPLPVTHTHTHTHSLTLGLSMFFSLPTVGLLVTSVSVLEHTLLLRWITDCAKVVQRFQRQEKCWAKQMPQAGKLLSQDNNRKCLRSSFVDLKTFFPLHWRVVTFIHQMKR